MTTRNIIIEPDAILRKKSETLEKVDNELKVLMMQCDPIFEFVFTTAPDTMSVPSLIVTFLLIIESLEIIFTHFIFLNFFSTSLTSFFLDLLSPTAVIAKTFLLNLF